MEKNYLVHYGILGQKWGVRRFQYEDGTYTEEGKLRKRKDDTGIDKKKVKKAAVATAAVLGTAAAALYVSKHPEIVAKAIGKLKDVSVKELSSKAIEKGKAYAKTVLEQSKKGAIEGLKNAPYKVAKVAAEGAAIMVAKEILDDVIGKENNEKLTKSYNAYNNKKGKVGSVPSFKEKKKKDEDD